MKQHSLKATPATKFNKKKIGIVLLALATVALCIFGGYFLYRKSQEKKAEVLYNQARAKLKSDDEEERSEAIAKLKDIHKKYPKTNGGNKALYHAGIAHYDTEEYTEAIEAFKASNYNTPSRQKCLGDCYYKLGQLEEALSHYDNAIKVPDVFGVRRDCLEKMMAIAKKLNDNARELRYLELFCEDYPNESGSNFHEIRKETLKATFQS